MADRTGIFEGGDPVEIARRWLSEAEALEPNDPNAMTLATVDAQGLPDARIVLLKALEGRGDGRPGGFVFYTNYEGAKARQIEGEGPGRGRAAILLHWKSLRRQVRARGRVARVNDAMSDNYYASRDLGSRLGAWASRQSRPATGRAEIEAAVRDAEAAHGANPGRPPHWGGYRLVPEIIELWSEGEHRLHDRHEFSDWSGDRGWTERRLYP